MKLKEGFDSNYRYVLVAARRARQLSSGAPRLVNTNASKTCKIAQEEIEAGKIQYVKTGEAGPTAPAENSAPECGEMVEERPFRAVKRNLQKMGFSPGGVESTSG